ILLLLSAPTLSLERPSASHYPLSHHSHPPPPLLFFFFTHTPTPEISPLSLHDALPISAGSTRRRDSAAPLARSVRPRLAATPRRSEEHTSELQSLTNLVCRLLLEKKNMKWHGEVHHSCDHQGRVFGLYPATVTLGLPRGHALVDSILCQCCYVTRMNLLDLVTMCG